MSEEELRDRVEKISMIMAQAHPAESLGNTARKILEYVDSVGPRPQELRPEHTAWIPVDLLFRDRYSGTVRHSPYMLVEVIKHGNEVMFQDAENGTHRMVAIQHIENTRSAIEIERYRVQGESTE